jgi:hypothetical protein
VLTACSPQGERRFYGRLVEALHANPEAYAANLETHFLRHLKPFTNGSNPLPLKEPGW